MEFIVVPVEIDMEVKDGCIGIICTIDQKCENNISKGGYNGVCCYADRGLYCWSLCALRLCGSRWLMGRKNRMKFIVLPVIEEITMELCPGYICVLH